MNDRTLLDVLSSILAPHSRALDARRRWQWLAACSFAGVQCIAAQTCNYDSPGSSGTAATWLSRSGSSTPVFLWGWGGCGAAHTGPGTYTQTGVLPAGEYSLCVKGIGWGQYGSNSTCNTATAALFDLQLGGPVSVFVPGIGIAANVTAGTQVTQSSTQWGHFEFAKTLVGDYVSLGYGYNIADSGLVVDVEGTPTAATRWTVHGLARGQSTKILHPLVISCFATFQAFYQFTVATPTSYTVLFDSTYVGCDLGVTCGGFTQDMPILPQGTSGSDGGWTFIVDHLGDPSTYWWYDPPAASGFEFASTGASKFTRIASFPAGIDADGLFTVSALGQPLGTFAVGQSVDFTASYGAPVSSFEITGIDPVVDGADPVAFPIALAFDAPLTEFRMIPIEPGTAPTTYGSGLAGTTGVPAIGWSDEWRIGNPKFAVTASSLGPGALGVLAYSTSAASIPLFGGDLLVGPSPLFTSVAVANGLGVVLKPTPIPNDPVLVGKHLYFQLGFLDSGAVEGIALTAGLDVVISS